MIECLECYVDFPSHICLPSIDNDEAFQAGSPFQRLKSKIERTLATKLSPGQLMRQLKDFGGLKKAFKETIKLIVQQWMVNYTIISLEITFFLCGNYKDEEEVAENQT